MVAGCNGANIRGDEHNRDDCMNSLSRRDWLKVALGGSAGLGVEGLLDVSAVRAATKEMKLVNVSEFTTSCNFCSCGCGMIASVRDGKLIAMEGDYDHIVNRGSLCVKGISMFATHASPNRLQTPKYRAPGSDHWVEISWQDAADRIARKIRGIRDATWTSTEKTGAKVVPGNRDEIWVTTENVGENKEVPVNRTDAIAFLGGAQNTNEECYLFQKAARLLGMPFVEHQARL